jgi:4-aminobutyrate aminotransferase-like enzyme
MTTEDFSSLRELAQRYCAKFDNTFRYFSAEDNPIFVRANGVYLHDHTGKKYLDLNSSSGALNFGHCHAELLEALTSQAATLHLASNRLTDKSIHLAQRLSLLSPIVDAQVYFDCGGANAVDAAKKLAIAYKRKPKIASFGYSFHGRTFGALSIYNSDNLKSQGIRIPKDYESFYYPYCLHCPVGLQEEVCQVECFGNLLEVYLERNQDIAAVIFEPGLGAGGYIFPPLKAIRRLSDICDRYGILLIADEIQMGMGRTGKMFSFQHYGVTPDIILLSKSLAGGMWPLSAVIARPEIMQSLPLGAHSSTFAGAPLASALGLKAIEILERDQLLEAAKVKGELLLEELKRVFPEEETGVRVEGRGLAIGIEFNDPSSGKPAPALKEETRRLAFQKGLFILGRGPYNNRLTLIPPLIIEQEQLLTAIELIHEAFHEARLSPKKGS